MHKPAEGEYPSAQRHSAASTAPGSDLVLAGQGVQDVLPSEFLNEFAGHGAQSPPVKKAPGAHTHAASAVLPLAEVVWRGHVWRRALAKENEAAVCKSAARVDRHWCAASTASRLSRMSIARSRNVLNN